MATEIRPATADEMIQMGAIGAYVYAGSFGDDADNMIAHANRPEWTLCAFVDGVMAASFSVFPLRMCSLGNDVKLGGVTAVGTLPEYRRRGLLRAMMSQAIQDMRERGQAVSSLWASQAAIYQRYGYARQSIMRTYQVDTVDINFYDGNVGDADVKRVPIDQAFEQIQALYTEYTSVRMGYLKRRPPLWQHAVLEHVDAEGPVHIAIAFEQETPVGYVVYTVRSGSTENPARRQRMIIRDLVALNSNGYRSLWRFVASHDLVGEVLWQRAPADDPAMSLFTEPRLLNPGEAEGTWLRIVDASVALAERGYCGRGELTLRVAEDSFAEWNTECFQLEASPEGARVAPAKSADIVLSINALSSLYSGFTSASQLAAIGLLEGSSEKIRMADQIFNTPYQPSCSDHF